MPSPTLVLFDVNETISELERRRWHAASAVKSRSTQTGLSNGTPHHPPQLEYSNSALSA
jgi:hypothetical protein